LDCAVVRQILNPDKHLELDSGDYGHRTWQNDPPSGLAQLSDVIDMGFAGPSTTIGEVLDTLSGPFCYLYI
jgi:tyrosinase